MKMGTRISEESQEKIKKYLDRIGEENPLVSEVTHSSRSNVSSNSETFSRVLKEAEIPLFI